MPWIVLHHVPAKTGSGISGEESEAAELLATYQPDYFVSGHRNCRQTTTDPGHIGNAFFIDIKEGEASGFHQKRVLREKCGHCGGVVLVVCLVQRLMQLTVATPRRSRCWTTRRSAVSFCWAKVGEVKLMANPTRITTERIFIGFLQVF